MDGFFYAEKRVLTAGYSVKSNYQLGIFSSDFEKLTFMEV